jgi:hypothetical protein
MNPTRKGRSAVVGVESSGDALWLLSRAFWPVAIGRVRRSTSQGIAWKVVHRETWAPELKTGQLLRLGAAAGRSTRAGSRC